MKDNQGVSITYRTRENPLNPQFQVLSAVQVERYKLSSSGKPGRVRGGQSYMSQESDTSKLCCSFMGGWPVSGSTLMADTDGDRKPHLYRGSGRDQRGRQ